MTDPILRIPLSEAEAHRAELAAAKARIATLEALAEMAAAPGLTVSDIRELLLSEANEDSGAVRSCLEGDDDDGDINVVDTICEMCSRLRHLTEEKAAATARADGLTQDALFESESRAEEEGKTAAAIKRVHAALLPLAPDAMCFLDSIEEALLALPSKLVPEELADERRRRVYAEQANDRIHSLLERHAGLSPAAEEDGVEAVLLKLCGVIEKPAKKAKAKATAKAARVKEKAKEKKPAPAAYVDGEPDWHPDGSRLRYLEEREATNTIMSGEAADLAAIRAGSRCRLCGRLEGDHVPLCPGAGDP